MYGNYGLDYLQPAATVLHNPAMYGAYGNYGRWGCGLGSQWSKDTEKRACYLEGRIAKDLERIANRKEWIAKKGRCGWPSRCKQLEKYQHAVDENTAELVALTGGDYTADELDVATDLAMLQQQQAQFAADQQYAAEQAATKSMLPLVLVGSVFVLGALMIVTRRR